MKCRMYVCMYVCMYVWSVVNSSVCLRVYCLLPTATCQYVTGQPVIIRLMQPSRLKPSVQHFPAPTFPFQHSRPACLRQKVSSARARARARQQVHVCGVYLGCILLPIPAREEDQGGGLRSGAFVAKSHLWMAHWTQGGGLRSGPFVRAKSHLRIAQFAMMTPWTR